MNRLWLRFLPIAGILLVNVAFWLDWINQGTWLVLLLILVAVYTLLSVVFFPMRKEIFSNASRANEGSADPDPPRDV